MCILWDISWDIEIFGEDPGFFFPFCWRKNSNDKWDLHYLPSGKRLHGYGTSPFSMGNFTISMVIWKIVM
jgi:hypothetical protein